MNWKEFLRPTRKKILLALLILAILPTAMYLYLKEFISSSLYALIVSFFTLPTYPIFLLLQIFMSQYSAAILNMFVGIPFAILWIYFISCLISWFYDIRFKILRKTNIKLVILIVLSILISISILQLLTKIPTDVCMNEPEYTQASEGYNHPRNRCYWTIAIKTNNSFWCEKINTNPHECYSDACRTLYHDLCYGYFCAIEKQEDACDEIIEGVMKIEAIAIKNNNSLYCQNILNIERRDGCIGRVNETYSYVLPD